MPNNQRILGLDVMRGISLFGILMVNMMSFHSPILYLNPLKWWTAPWDHFTYIVIDLFFQASFYPLFSLLFGYSLVIFRRRALEKGQPFNSMVMRRFAFLVIAGLIHALFIWHGDILTVYALLGFLSLPFLKMAPKVLVLAGGLFYLIANTLFAIFLFVQKYFQLDPVNISGNRKLAIAAVQIYQQGTFGEITGQRVHDWMMEYNPQAIILLLFTVFPLFLIGAGLAKLRVLEKAERHKQEWRKVYAWTLLLGLLFKLLPYLDSHTRTVEFLQDVFGGSLQAVSYASMIVLLLNNNKTARFLKLFSNVGKMSLTNYLLQSILSTMTFYGYGLKFFGKITLLTGSLLALSFFLLQLLFSIMWMGKHTYGPGEWVWRSVTNLQAPSWKKTI